MFCRAPLLLAFPASCHRPMAARTPRTLPSPPVAEKRQVQSRLGAVNALAGRAEGRPSAGRARCTSVSAPVACVFASATRGGISAGGQSFSSGWGRGFGVSIASTSARLLPGLAREAWADASVTRRLWTRAVFPLVLRFSSSRSAHPVYVMLILLLLLSLLRPPSFRCED